MQLEDFCLKNKNVVGIYDEYGKKYTWKQYYDRWLVVVVLPLTYTLLILLEKFMT